MKQQIDAELPMTEESLEFIDNGRTFLIDREFRLINARKIALETLKSNRIVASTISSSASQLPSYDPFNRKEALRRSAGNPLMNLFRRNPSTVLTPSQVVNVQGKLSTTFKNNKNALSIIFQNVKNSSWVFSRVFLW